MLFDNDDNLFLCNKLLCVMFWFSRDLGSVLISSSLCSAFNVTRLKLTHSIYAVPCGTYRNRDRLRLSHWERPEQRAERRETQKRFGERGDGGRDEREHRS